MGNVRALYVGKFKNGEFEDEINEAWYIVKNENTKYMNCKGQFKEGHPQTLLGREVSSYGKIFTIAKMYYRH